LIRGRQKPAAGSKGLTSHHPRMPSFGRACRSGNELVDGSLGTEAPARGSPAREAGRPRLAPKGESPAREARTEGQRAGGTLARKGGGSEGTGTGGRADRKVGRTKGPGSPEGHPQGRPEREPRPDRKVTRKGGRKRGSRRFAEETVAGATESGSWPFGAGAPGAPAGQPQGTRRGVEAIVLDPMIPVVERGVRDTPRGVACLKKEVK